MTFFNQILTTILICYLCTTMGILFILPSSTYKLFKSENTTLNRIMSETELSFMSSISSASSLIVTPFSAYLLDTLGRKGTLIIFYLPQLFSWGLLVTIFRVETFIFSMFLCGLSGSIFLIAPIYINEYCDPCIRGAMSSCTVICHGVGVMMSYLLGGLLDYNTMNYTGLTLTVVGLVLICFIKESPLYLMKRGYEEEAAKSIAFYNGIKCDSTEVKKQMANIRSLFSAVKQKDAEQMLNTDKYKSRENIPKWEYMVVLTRQIWKSSIKLCDCKVSMKGKIVIVTGANTGIGFYTASNLAARGARIILACRDPSRGGLARDSIIAATGNHDVVFKPLDLASLDSVRNFARNIIATEDRLDVIVNNAGVYGLGDQYTKDGIIEAMQVNIFGPFLLTILLLDLLKKSQPSRIINVTSVLHFLGQTNFKLINKPTTAIRTYANSKLYNIIFTVELARRLQGMGVVVNAVHPGAILTNITAKSNIIVRSFFQLWAWICCRTANEGAQTIVHLAVAEDCERVSGKYFVDFTPRFSLPSSQNEFIGTKFWNVAEKLVGLQ